MPPTEMELARCIEREREAWDRVDGSQHLSRALRKQKLDTARAATDQAVKAVEGVLGDMIDDDPCQLDHHGYCQTHGWMSKSECFMARARKLLPTPAPIAQGDTTGGENGR